MQPRTEGIPTSNGRLERTYRQAVASLFHAGAHNLPDPCSRRRTMYHFVVPFFVGRMCGLRTFRNLIHATAAEFRAAKLQRTREAGAHCVHSVAPLGFFPQSQGAIPCPDCLATRSPPPCCGPPVPVAMWTATARDAPLPQERHKSLQCWSGPGSTSSALRAASGGGASRVAEAGGPKHHDPVHRSQARGALARIDAG